MFFSLLSQISTTMTAGDEGSDAEEICDPISDAVASPSSAEICVSQLAQLLHLFLSTPNPIFKFVASLKLFLQETVSADAYSTISYSCL